MLYAIIGVIIGIGLCVYLYTRRNYINRKKEELKNDVIDTVKKV